VFEVPKSIARRPLIIPILIDYDVKFTPCNRCSFFDFDIILKPVLNRDHKKGKCISNGCGNVIVVDQTANCRRLAGFYAGFISL
jgi:hypothetical protein